MPKRDEVDPRFKVQDGLTYTPAQMDMMRKQGIPISSYCPSDDQFDDGALSPQLSPEYCRGFSLIDAWNDAMESKSKIMNHVKQQTS